MPLDVPAHVEYTPHVQNNVLVEPGNNWDFSRSARVTPVEPASDAPVLTSRARYDAADGIPASQPLAVLHFTQESIVADRSEQKALLDLPKGAPLIVAAHGDAGESDAQRLSHIRAETIAALLRSKGYEVAAVKAFGSNRPAAGVPAAANRIVVIFAAPEA